MGKRFTALFLSATLIAAFAGCRNNDDDILIVPADQISLTNSINSENQNSLEGDIAMDITKLESGNLQSGGIYYASYKNTYFFNYFFENNDNKNGQATLYEKDTFGVITPVGIINISFEVPNYPQGLYVVNDVIYYSIPYGSGSGIYQILADGSDNRIVAQTPNDLKISRLEYTNDKIYYSLSSPNDADERCGIYYVDILTGISAKIEIESNGIFTRDENNYFYYQNPLNKSEIIIADTEFKQFSKVDLTTSDDILKLLVYDNYLYYYTSNGNLSRTQIATGKTNKIVENYDISSFIVVEDMLFFTGTDDTLSKPNHHLHTIDPNGEYHLVMTVEQADTIMSDGDWIYAYVTQSEEFIPGYRIRLDGTDYESSVIVG